MAPPSPPSYKKNYIAAQLHQRSDAKQAHYHNLVFTIESQNVSFNKNDITLHIQ